MKQWMEGYTYRMYDLSEFMKSLKLRFFEAREEGRFDISVVIQSVGTFTPIGGGGVMHMY